ncbi:hypothetical protein [Cryobacterium sp. GrIS_2_6]|uniref:hypothetical protein n=1 Tax=Cryobacterium sp. GrIS_2_6 TaxID=3162785 RepID=UPI002DFF661C|nr:hypothetical protein [Cryobacterium psychrotolerans]
MGVRATVAQTTTDVAESVAHTRTVLFLTVVPRVARVATRMTVEIQIARLPRNTLVVRLDAQLLFVYTPFMNLWFSSTPIGAREWGLADRSPMTGC